MTALPIYLKNIHLEVEYAINFIGFIFKKQNPSIILLILIILSLIKCQITGFTKIKSNKKDAGENIK